MPIRSYNPTTPSLRYIKRSTFEELTKGENGKRKRPERKLVKAKKRSGGRNSDGRITMRGRGGGQVQHEQRRDVAADRLHPELFSPRVDNVGVAHHGRELSAEDEVVVYPGVQSVHRIGLADVVGQLQAKFGTESAVALDVVLIDR